ncbi:MAG: M23 family metallopeptidase [Ruminococcus sp.]|nr:M23 family metallopeptidase [Ruminococcus sp.]
MKKNLFSDNKQGSKGFCAALGISAVMIGWACWFAYGQSRKLTDELTAKNSVSESEAPVNKRAYSVPKTTTAVRTTVPVRTAVKTTVTAASAPAATLPAASVNISVSGQEEAHDSAAKLSDTKPPLKDMSFMITGFSGSELVRNETTGSWQTHNGTDFAAEVGSDVYAVSGGDVTEVKNDPVWGITVTVDHKNGFVTRYCGLSQTLEVQQGDALAAGDLIGTVGNTADIESSLTPHLHLEILHNGAYIDPMSELT